MPSGSVPNSTPRARIAWRLAALFRPYAAQVSGCVALLCLVAGLATLGPILVRRAIDIDIAAADARGLAQTVALYLCVEVLHLGAAYGVRVWLESVGQALLAGLKRRLIDHLLELPMAFFDRHAPGQLLSAVQNDTQALRALFSSASVTLLSDALMLAAMLGVMGVASLRLTLLLMLVVPLAALLTRLFHARTHALFLEARRLTAELCARLAEAFEGIGLLRAFERRAWAAARLAQTSASRYEALLAGERLFISWFHSLMLLQVLGQAVVLLAGGFWVLHGALTLGTLAMFLGYVRRFFAPLVHLSEQLGEIQRGLSAGERVQRLLDEPISIREPERPVAWPSGPTDVCFEDVWFRYEPEGDFILRGVSFRIPAGERWAIVGSTGAGKSTVVSLLLRFYEPDRGRVLLGDIDARRLPSRELRRHVGLVLQDVDLFPTDILSNITMGHPHSRHRIDEATRLVQARELVARLPQGLDTQLVEHGRNLSMGERQLLSFARAVVGAPAVLMLDEATSALDPGTEALVSRGIEGMLRGRTALVVAHRLATVRTCHRILVLEAGRIVEQGTHEELLAARGRYRELHEKQCEVEERARAS